MGKAKIGFEVDENDLANAKAFVAKHGGSLNKLVSALFASLGQADASRAPALDPSTRILMSASTGEISVTEAARLLDVPDAGYVLRRLADHGFPLPGLSQSDAQKQLEAARQALDECLLEPAATPRKRRKRAGRPIET